MSGKTKNPLRPIISNTTSIFIFLIIAYIGLMLGGIFDLDVQRRELYQTLSNQVQMIGSEVWRFIRPFLQITVLLLIVDWIFGKLGIKFSKDQDFDWNVQTVIALVVIGAFALAALTGIQGVTYLKDLALVVVGFYFGTQRKITELNKGDTVIKTVEEHDNPVPKNSDKQKGEIDTNTSEK